MSAAARSIAAAQRRASSATWSTTGASGGTDDLPLLQGSHAVARFDGSLDPPSAVGTTWSTRSSVSAATAPQYRHLKPSRRRISYRRRLETLDITPPP